MRRFIYILSWLFLLHELLPQEAGVPGNFYTIMGSTVNIRSKPDLKSPKTGVLKKGDQVQFIEDNFEGQMHSETIDAILAPWVKIRTREGKEGWIFGGYLSNPGEQAPILGKKCLDFSVSPLQSFKGGCVTMNLEYHPSSQHECEMEFGGDGSFSIFTSSRSRSEGSWILKGDTIFIQIKKWSWEDLYEECSWEAPLDPVCLKAQKKKYGKKDFYIWGKATLSLDLKKKKFQVLSMPSWDPEPIVGKDILKSRDWKILPEILNESCLVPLSN